MQKVPIDIVFKSYSRSKVTKISFSRISRIFLLIGLSITVIMKIVEQFSIKKSYIFFTYEQLFYCNVYYSTGW